MSEKWKKPAGEGSKTLREDRDRLFSELETKLLAIVRSGSGETIPRKAIGKIEFLLDDYYKRWKK